MSKSTQPPIIIVQADHGSGFLLNENAAKTKDGTPIWPKDPSDEMLLERFNIFSAIYLPKKDLDIFKTCKTPVNIFRYIFNNFFDKNYEILPEKQYYGDYVDRFNLQDLTIKVGRGFNKSTK